MSDFMSHVKTINSSVRTLVIVGACGVIGYGGYFGYENYIKPSHEAKQVKADFESLKLEYEEQNSQLQKVKESNARISADLKVANADLKVAKELNERLATSMKLLKVDRRVANITCLDKGKDEDGNPYMNVSFSEMDEDGKPIGTKKTYTLKGEKFYVDGWIANFEDKYIEQADGLRGASLFVFKSIYGDGETPRDAQRLDVETNNGPGIYQNEEQSEFEKKIWKDFWRFSTDINLQREIGIRATHGVSNYILPREGKTYEISIRASGGMSLRPIDEP